MHSVKKGLKSNHVVPIEGRAFLKSPEQHKSRTKQMKSKAKMDILVVSRSSFTSDRNQGGADRHALKLAIDLAKQNSEVSSVVFVGRRFKILQESGCEVVEVKSPKSIESGITFFYYLNGFILNSISAVTALKFLKKHQTYKYLSTHSNIATILVRTFFKSSIVAYRMHDPMFSSSDLKGPLRFITRFLNNYLLEKIAMRQAQILVVTSPRALGQIPSKYLHKTHLQFSPVEVVNGRSSIHEEVSDNLPKNFALSIGYQNERKRFDLLIKAWKYVDSDFHLVMVGDGPKNSLLKNLVKEYDLEERITFVGYIPNDELDKYYQAADMSLLASERENFPSIMVESVKHGVPALFVYNDAIDNYSELQSDYLEITNEWTSKAIARKINQFRYSISSYERRDVVEWANRVFNSSDLGQSLVELFKKVNSGI